MVVDRGALRGQIDTLLALFAERSKENGKLPELSSKRDTSGALSPWEIVQAARAQDRPTTLDYVAAIAEPFIELHGDQQGGDDPAVVVGLGRIGSYPMAIAGFERGHGSDQAERRFGRPMPHGYRKIQRIMRLAARLRIPLVTFVDTPGAYPGTESEAAGLAHEIAQTLAIAGSLKTPVVAIITGEGGSGGALTLAIADRVIIQEHAFFSVIAPEGAAAILYRDGSRAPELAEALKITPQALLELGLVDEIIAEYSDGLRLDFDVAAGQIHAIVVRALDELTKRKPAKLVEDRSRRYRTIGAEFVKSSPRHREPRDAESVEPPIIAQSA
jgi:acetyl-CoA carboxylase carboxyl transferase subunit beta